jgi:hypothetical protein
VPAVPHYPSEEPRKDEQAPDIDDILDRILDRDEPSPTIIVA